VNGEGRGECAVDEVRVVDKTDTHTERERQRVKELEAGSWVEMNMSKNNFTQLQQSEKSIIGQSRSINKGATKYRVRRTFIPIFPFSIFRLQQVTPTHHPLTPYHTHSQQTNHTSKSSSLIPGSISHNEKNSQFTLLPHKPYLLPSSLHRGRAQ
jgi:hypothetical protein